MLQCLKDCNLMLITYLKSKFANWKEQRGHNMSVGMIQTIINVQVVSMITTVAIRTGLYLKTTIIKFISGIWRMMARQKLLIGAKRICQTNLDLTD